MLEIRVFGELELRQGGRMLALPPSKKSRALLGFLVVTGRPHLREALCDLLWPGPDDPRAALRWSLTKIRSLVDEGRTTRLLADRERVGFEGKGAEIDLLSLRGLVGEDVSSAPVPSLVRAAALYRGELLEGLDLGDCYRYHEWCVAEREAARAIRIKVLAALVSALEESPEEALPHARARVAVDPLSEAAHVEVIRILGRLGKKREGLAQFETCKRILQVELGQKPSAALLHARSTLGSERADPHEGGLGESRQARGAFNKTTAPILVGRTRERAVIAERVTEAARGRAQPLTLFVGEAGIGKTSLLHAAADAMRSAAGVVFTVRAFEAERGRPYGPFIDAFEQLATLVEERVPLGAGPRDGDQGQLFDAVSRLFTRAAARAPVAILVDDLQWFDEASTALLHLLSRSAPPNVLFVCAARPAELDDNLSAQRLVHALLRESRLDRHELGSLDLADVTALTDGLGAKGAAERVFAESGGHPYFAVEIARALARGDHVMAPSLAAMIDDRLARVSPLAQSLVPWAAAMRRSFDLDLLARVTGLDPSEVVTSALELEQHRVLAARPEGYDFAHDLVRSVAYRRLSEPRRRLIHLQIARTLGASASGPRASDVAYHAGLGMDHEMAARASLAAGRFALQVFANHEAAEVARSGIEHAGSLPESERLPLQVALLDVVVHSGTWRARVAELEAELTRIIGECEAAGVTESAAAALQWLSTVQRDRGTFDSAAASTLRAAHLSRTSDPAARAERLAATAKCLTMLEREMPRAREMIDEAEALAHESRSEPIDLPWAHGMMLFFEGHGERAKAALERVLELARGSETRWAQFECLLRLALIGLEEGRPREAFARSGELAAVAAKMKEGSEAAAAQALDALARLGLGETGARERVERAAELLVAADAKGLLSYVLASLARFDLESGRLESARQRATQALAAADAVRRRSDQALARVILARVALASGDRDEARAQISDVLADCGAPLVLSARAKREVADVAKKLGLAIPTPAPTIASTPEAHSP